jgi:hypothetical protein
MKQKVSRGFSFEMAKRLGCNLAIAVLHNEDFNFFNYGGKRSLNRIRGPHGTASAFTPQNRSRHEN